MMAALLVTGSDYRLAAQMENEMVGLLTASLVDLMAIHTVARMGPSKVAM